MRICADFLSFTRENLPNQRHPRSILGHRASMYGREILISAISVLARETGGKNPFQERSKGI